MTITPTGIFSEPLFALREMVASLSEWQSWVSAADAEAAAERVYLFGTTPEYAWPLCLIDDANNMLSERMGVENAGHWMHSGTASLYIADDVRPDLDEIDAGIHFRNLYAGVWEGLQGIAAVLTESGLRVHILSITHALPPTRTEPKERQRNGDRYEAAMQINWRAVRT